MREGESMGVPHLARRASTFRSRHKKPGAWRRFVNTLKNHLVWLLAVWGALFSAATWFYIYVLQPRTVPVNISLALELKKINPARAASPNGRRLVAVEMQLTATNPSSREVYLMPNIWVAYGYRVAPPLPALAFGPLLDRAFGELDKGQRPVERFAGTTDGVVVAGGTLFSDTALKPSEKITRKLVFHLPRDIYDVVEVWTAIPTTSKPGKLLVRWQLKGQGVEVDVRCRNELDCHLKQDGPGRYTEETLELQQSSSRTALSLWE